LMRGLAALPPLFAFLGRVIARLAAASGSQAGVIFERRGNQLYPAAVWSPEAEGAAQVPGDIRLVTVEQALADKVPLLGGDAAVFPFGLPDGSDGVVYLKEPAITADPKGLLIYQAFINLIPVAFLTLRRAGEAAAASEVAGEEVHT
ncbi:MAG: hypothetical protein ACRD2T_12535, partial [Thermoanaerobaculia bacterium]